MGKLGEKVYENAERVKKCEISIDKLACANYNIRVVRKD